MPNSIEELTKTFKKFIENDQLQWCYKSKHKRT